MKPVSSHSSSLSAIKAIVWSGLMQVHLISWGHGLILGNVPAEKVLQSVASGKFGKEAYA